MSLISHCLDCAAAAPILGRFAGVFGLVEIHSPYCRACIANHAEDLDTSAHEIVAHLDATEAACPGLH